MNNCTWSLTGLLLTTADWSELMMSLSGGAPWIQWKPGIRRPDCLGEKHRSSFSCLEKWLNTVCLTKVQDCFWIIKQKKFFFLNHAIIQIWQKCSRTLHSWSLYSPLRQIPEDDSWQPLYAEPPLVFLIRGVIETAAHGSTVFQGMRLQ